MSEMTPARHERAPSDPNAEAAALQMFELMERGTLAEFEELTHPDMVNHEAKDEPPESRVKYGPAAAYATALWLREAFADLRWDIHEVVAERDLVVVHCTMSGRHVRPFASYDENAEVKEVFPPTGREFATTQTHWMRMADGKMVEHWANRDDLGTAEQLGWVPPSLAYLVRMALAKRRAKRATRSMEARPGGNRPSG
jgi:predicted ester cyclase